MPLAVTIRTADGTEHHSVFKLARASRLEPGAHVHVQADLDPAQAAAARQLVIGHTDS